MTWILIVVFNGITDPQATKDAPMVVPGFDSRAECERGARRVHEAMDAWFRSVDTLCYERSIADAGHSAG